MVPSGATHATNPPREALGESEAFLKFQERLSQAARVDRPVLLIGERGTGKELAAARLHYLSSRWGEPLVTLNCAAFPAGLIEAELFGHEAGAFTGAGRRRVGRFEAANRGSLFLDEIGNIPLEVQAKILRVVEYQTFERLGSSAPTSVNVRLIAATNADLPALVEAGRFRADLLDRLSFEVLILPPLRERYGDIPLLANYFAARMAHELGLKSVPIFSEEAMAALEDYPWPGNVRELKNVVERAVHLAESEQIKEVTIQPFPGRKAIPPQEKPPIIEVAVNEPALDVSLPAQVAALEIRLLETALKKTHYSQRKAAELLGLTYNQFRGLYRKYQNNLSKNSKAYPESLPVEIR